MGSLHAPGIEPVCNEPCNVGNFAGCAGYVDRLGEAGQVERDDVESVGQKRDESLPGVTVVPQPVQQHQRFTAAAAVDGEISAHRRSVLQWPRCPLRQGG